MTIFGYTFRNDALADEALTTPACKMDQPGIRDNQRLEFLGDAVLGFLAAEQLYGMSADEEGDLTVKRTHMVSTAALCPVAARENLASLLRRNHGAEPLPPHSKTFADAVEAIIGAAYLDGGIEAARTVFAGLRLSPDAPIANPKGELQIRAQAMARPSLPVYTLVSVSGKAHAPTFRVAVEVAGLGRAEASAGSRHEAEALAAAALLKF